MKVEINQAAVRDRLKIVRENVADALERSGRPPNDTRVLVATKYYSPEQMSALAGAGVRLVGENRAQDLAHKQESFGEAFE